MPVYDEYKRIAGVSVWDHNEHAAYTFEALWLLKTLFGLAATLAGTCSYADGASVGGVGYLLNKANPSATSRHLPGMSRSRLRR